MSPIPIRPAVDVGDEGLGVRRRTDVLAWTAFALALAAAALLGVWFTRGTLGRVPTAVLPVTAVLAAALAAVSLARSGRLSAPRGVATAALVIGGCVAVVTFLVLVVLLAFGLLFGNGGLFG
jgi:hypothetical protein